MRTNFAAERRRQLDRIIIKATDTPPPPTGWLAAIRAALGITSPTLSRRMGITSSTLLRMEQREAAGTITLNSLRKHADALGCDLVYALVPRAGSLEATIREQALRVARGQVTRVSHSMALESQQVEADHQEQQIHDLADELVRTLSQDLWSADR